MDNSQSIPGDGLNASALDGAMDPSELVDKIDPSPIVRRLRKEISALHRRNAELKCALGDQEDLFDTLRGALQTMPPHAETRYWNPSGDIEGRLIPVSMFSDWHIGAIIDEDEIEGFNLFHLEEAKDRLSRYDDQMLTEVRRVEKSGWLVDEIVLVFAGDLLSGDIHDELKITNEFPIPFQIREAALLVAERIRCYAPFFKRVRVEFIVPDNHSRRGPKIQYKQAGENSYNYLVGWIAHEFLKDIDNVEFNLYTGIKQVIQVGPLNYLVMHGHTIRGWAGFPWYGADRSNSREAKARRFSPNQFHRMLIGHFHVPMNTQEYIVNGSLSGTDEFDHGQGRHALPAQNLWFVDAETGRERGWQGVPLS